MSNQPRRQHFVQLAHLKQFLLEGNYLRVFHCNGDEYPATPQNLFVQKDLYTQKSKGGYSAEFEKTFSEIENRTWSTIRQIIFDERIASSYVNDIAAYLALSRIRNPSFRNEAVRASKQIFLHIANRFVKFDVQDDLKRAACHHGIDLSEMIDQHQHEEVNSNRWYLNQIKTAFDTTYRILSSQFQWHIVRSCQNKVIISDHPLTIAQPGIEYGLEIMRFGGRGCEVAFPISKRLYLLGLWNAQRVNIDSEEAVSELNRRQAVFANERIARGANEGWESELIGRYKHHSYQYKLNIVRGSNETSPIVFIGKSGVFPKVASSQRHLTNPMGDVWQIFE